MTKKTDEDFGTREPPIVEEVLGMIFTGYRPTKPSNLSRRQKIRILDTEVNQHFGTAQIMAQNFYSDMIPIGKELPNTTMEMNDPTNDIAHRIWDYMMEHPKRPLNHDTAFHTYFKNDCVASLEIAYTNLNEARRADKTEDIVHYMKEAAKHYQRARFDFLGAKKALPVLRADDCLDHRLIMLHQARMFERLSSKQRNLFGEGQMHHLESYQRLQTYLNTFKQSYLALLGDKQTKMDEPAKIHKMDHGSSQRA